MSYFSLIAVDYPSKILEPHMSRRRTKERELLRNELIAELSWHQRRNDARGTLPAVLCVLLQDGSQLFFEGEEAEQIYPELVEESSRDPKI